ncbi:MAG: hypothetical protein ACTHN5_04320 [Phycisphaerae bacterium]
MRAIACRASIIGLLVILSGIAGGCSHDLFSDSESRTQRTLRYYDNDSATQTTAARRQSVGSPFGMPQGGAQQ